MTRPRAVVSWSSGKDSAWALHTARDSLDIVGLLTTTSLAPAAAGQSSEPVERVSMHGVRRSLLDAQARALGLGQYVVDLPWPCSNDEYEARMRAMVERLVADGIEVHVRDDSPAARESTILAIRESVRAALGREDAR